MRFYGEEISCLATSESSSPSWVRTWADTFSDWTEDLICFIQAFLRTVRPTSPSVLLKMLLVFVLKRLLGRAVTFVFVPPFVPKN